MVATITKNNPQVNVGPPCSAALWPLYGDDMMHGGPSTMAPHVQSEFEGGIKWGFAKAQRQHEVGQHGPI